MTAMVRQNVNNRRGRLVALGATVAGFAVLLVALAVFWKRPSPESEQVEASMPEDIPGGIRQLIRDRKSYERIYRILLQTEDAIQNFAPNQFDGLFYDGVYPRPAERKSSDLLRESVLEPYIFEDL